MAEAKSSVKVLSLAGNTVAEISPAPDSVGLLKAELEGQCGVPSALQRLLRGAVVLGDEEHLGSSSLDQITFVVDESPLSTWDIAGNPNSDLLSGAGSEVMFANQEVDFVNVVAQEPVRSGVHFFEFVMHHVGDEQWCGLSPSKARAVSRAGYNGESMGFFYYSGHRFGFGARSGGALHAPSVWSEVNKMENVSTGDVIGMLVDIDRGALVFTWNGTVQDGLFIPKKPMYATTILDHTRDQVELRRAAAADAPEGAQNRLDAVIEAEKSDDTQGRGFVVDIDGFVGEAIDDDDGFRRSHGSFAMESSHSDDSSSGARQDRTGQVESECSDNAVEGNHGDDASAEDDDVFWELKPVD